MSDGVALARLARLARLHAPLAALLGAGLARAAGDAPPAPGVPSIDVSRLPAPGSYRLDRIQRAPDGEVLTTGRQVRRLHALLRGRISVVGFVYTYCRDPVGCPLAWKVMNEAFLALRADPALARRVQLVSLSFDPTNDTPERMADYGRGRRDDASLRWLFLTTASVRKLMPLLDGFGQDVSVETDEIGRPTRTLNHLLKVFLVDEALAVREIYSVATLDATALRNDAATLAAESTASAAR